MVSMTRIF